MKSINLECVGTTECPIFQEARHLLVTGCGECFLAHRLLDEELCTVIQLVNHKILELEDE